MNKFGNAALFAGLALVGLQASIFTVFPGENVTNALKLRLLSWITLGDSNNQYLLPALTSEFPSYKYI